MKPKQLQRTAFLCSEFCGDARTLDALGVEDKLAIDTDRKALDAFRSKWPGSQIHYGSAIDAPYFEMLRDAVWLDFCAPLNGYTLRTIAKAAERMRHVGGITGRNDAFLAVTFLKARDNLLRGSKGSDVAARPDIVRSSAVFASEDLNHRWRRHLDMAFDDRCDDVLRIMREDHPQASPAQLRLALLSEVLRGEGAWHVMAGAEYFGTSPMMTVVFRGVGLRRPTYNTPGGFQLGVHKSAERLWVDPYAMLELKPDYWEICPDTRPTVLDNMGGRIPWLRLTKRQAATDLRTLCEECDGDVFCVKRQTVAAWRAASTRARKKAEAAALDLTVRPR